MVGECSLEPTRLALGDSEVDHPRIHAMAGEDRHRAGSGSHVVDLGREHHRRHQHDRRSRAALGEVMPQLEDPPLGGDLIRGRLLVGGEPTEPRHLESILRRRAETPDRARKG
jgi:hypothetical protein